MYAAMQRLSQVFFTGNAIHRLFMHATSHLATDSASALVTITPPDFPVIIDLVYATPRNFTGHVVYAQAQCALHADAAACLARAAQAARRAGYTLKIFDAYRPPAAQAVFWALCPDPRYVSDVSVGSHHSRGVAVDVTLLDGNGCELDMGTGFDAMEAHSHHDCDDLSVEAQRNRSMLLGIMLHAGFKAIATEWWHYELPDAHRYPLLDSDVVLVREMTGGANTAVPQGTLG